MIPKLPTFALPVLALVALLGVIVLAALGVDVPAILEFATTTLIGGAAGQALPTAPAGPPAAE